MSLPASSKSGPPHAGHPLMVLTTSPSNTASDFLDDLDSITVSNLTTDRRASNSLTPHAHSSFLMRAASESSSVIQDVYPAPPASLAALRASSPPASVAAVAGGGTPSSAMRSVPRTEALTTTTSPARGRGAPARRGSVAVPAVADDPAVPTTRARLASISAEVSMSSVGGGTPRSHADVAHGEEAPHGEASNMYPVEVDDDLNEIDPAPAQTVSRDAYTTSAATETGVPVNDHAPDVGHSAPRLHVRRSTLPGSTNAVVKSLSSPPPLVESTSGASFTATAAAASTSDVTPSRTPISFSPAQVSLEGALRDRSPMPSMSAANAAAEGGGPAGPARIIVAARVRPSKHEDGSGQGAVTVAARRGGSASEQNSSTTLSRVMHRRRGQSYLRVDAPHDAIECIGAVGTVDSGSVASGVSPASPSLSPARTSSTSPQKAAKAARGSLRFRFDAVFDANATQTQVMEAIGSQAVDQVLHGYNGTLLCYGQSGCGKTHTMYGPRGGRFAEADTSLLGAREGSPSAGVGDCEKALPEAAGLAPRMLHRLFAALQQQQAQNGGETTDAAASFDVSISALELYNEELRDLLPSPKLLRSLRAKKQKAKDAKASMDMTGEAEGGGRDQGSEEDEKISEAGDDDDEDDDGEDELEGRHTVAQVGTAPRSHTPGHSPVNSPLLQASTDTKRAKSTPAGGGAGGGTDSSRRARGVKKWAKSASAAPSHLAIRSGAPDDNTKVSVHVAGLRAHKVTSVDDAMMVVQAALRERRMGATRLNVDSNRAHMLLFVRVRQSRVLPATSTQAGGVQRHRQTSQAVLTLVDLAGSERVSRTGADGVRLREAQSINLSLSTLGNVIRRLATRAKADANTSTTTAPSAAGVHVPYRDSKLTRILQDSFGGNAITFLLCNVSSDEIDFQETVSALRFGSEATLVQNRAVRNTATTTEVQERERAELQKASASLQSSLDVAKSYIQWLERQLDFFSRQCVLMLEKQEAGTAAVLESVEARMAMEKQRLADERGFTAEDDAALGVAGVESSEPVTSVQAQVRQLYAQLEHELSRQRELEDALCHTLAAEAPAGAPSSSRRSSTASMTTKGTEAAPMDTAQTPPPDAHQAPPTASARTKALEEALAEKDTIIQALQAALDDKYREADALREQQVAEEEANALRVLQHYGQPVTELVPQREESGGDGDEEEVADALLADYRSGSSAVILEPNVDEEEEDKESEAPPGSALFALGPQSAPAAKLDASTQTELCGVPSMFLPLTSSSSNVNDPLSEGVSGRQPQQPLGGGGAPLVPLTAVRSTSSWQSVDGAGSEMRFISRGATPPASSLRASRQLWIKSSAADNSGVAGDGTVAAVRQTGRLERLLAGFRLATALVKSEPNFS